MLSVYIVCGGIAGIAIKKGISCSVQSSNHHHLNFYFCKSYLPGWYIIPTLVNTTNVGLVPFTMVCVTFDSNVYDGTWYQGQ